MADIAKNFFKVVVGLILIVLPIWAVTYWRDWGQATLDLIKGGVVIGIILVGLLFLLLGFTGMKE